MEVTASAFPRRRGALLAAFCLLVVTTQLIWLTFAPVTTETARALGVSEGMVGDLAVVNPLLFVLLALPAGRLMDRSLHLALGLGAAFTLVGALVRLVDTGSYGWLLVGQVLASVGQPFVLNATTPLAARAFPAEERAHAIAAGSAAQFLGVLLAAAGGGAVVSRVGIDGLLVVHAVVALAASAGVLVMLRSARLLPVETVTTGSWAWLRRDPLVWRLAVLLLVGVGVFNALATWLDPVMDGLGYSGVGGPLVAVTTLAGIIGAAVLPGPAATRGRRREVLLLATSTTLVVFRGAAHGRQPRRGRARARGPAVRRDAGPGARDHRGGGGARDGGGVVAATWAGGAGGDVGHPSVLVVGARLVSLG